MSRSRPTDLALNLLLSASVTATLLAGGEALCRWREKPSKPLDAPDRVTDWEREWGDDFYVVRSDSAGWPPSDDFNRDGVRDRERGREKPQGTHRVVCLGDSVTLGYGLRHEASYPNRLQARLEENGPGTEVMTVALMGWSTRQERLAYVRIARGYAPDLVLLGICLNDLQDLENNLARPPRALVWLHERSALLRRIVDARGREIRSVRELVTDPDSARVRESYRRLFEEIRGLRDDVTRDGGRFAVVVFPFADQVQPEPMAATPQRRIEAFCAGEGISFRDLLPGLRRLGPGAFIPGDHLHLSAEGSAQAAEVLAGSGLVPPEWASSADLGRALGRVGNFAPGPGDVPVLAKLVATGTLPFRTQAAWALGRVGASSRSAWPPLAAPASRPRTRSGGSGRGMPVPPCSMPSRMSGREYAGRRRTRSRRSAFCPAKTRDGCGTRSQTRTTTCGPSRPGSSGRWGPGHLKRLPSWRPSSAILSRGSARLRPPRWAGWARGGRASPTPSPARCATGPGPNGGGPPARLASSVRRRPPPSRPSRRP